MKTRYIPRYIKGKWNDKAIKEYEVCPENIKELYNITRMIIALCIIQIILIVLIIDRYN